MLAELLNVPHTVHEWNRFSFHHRQSHVLIRQAIFAQSGLNLVDYLLDPIPLNNPKGFLENNQQAHVDMDQALGSQSVNLLDVDLNDENEKTAWIYLHYLEHQTAEQILGIGS